MNIETIDDFLGSICDLIEGESENAILVMNDANNLRIVRNAEVETIAHRAMTALRYEVGVLTEAYQKYKKIAEEKFGYTGI